ncbi:MAG: SRPBCC family protein [Gemmatimonadetes bacterium]|nr:SRPBCC family protein [Gemmatimonadota bacterium]
MSQQSASIIIARSPDDVFAYMDDTAREHEWQPNLKSAEQDPAGPTRVGTRKSYTNQFMGRDVENTYVVTLLEPGRRVVYETAKGSAVDARSEILCEAAVDGTKVTMSITGTPKGVLRFVPSALLEIAYREELNAALSRLKKQMESGG